jgi:hypothetical protein
MSGPRRGSRCSICNHNQVLIIDELLTVPNPRSFRQLAAEFGVNEKQLSRHLASHVLRQVAPRPSRTPHAPSGSAGSTSASPEQPEAAEVDPADVLKRQLAYLDGLSLEGLSPSQRTDVLEARRRTADSLSRISPPPAPSVVRVADVAGLGEMFEVIHEALKPWPEARAAIAQALRDAGLMKPATPLPRDGAKFAAAKEEAS